MQLTYISSKKQKNKRWKYENIYEYSKNVQKLPAALDWNCNWNLQILHFCSPWPVNLTSIVPYD